MLVRVCEVVVVVTGVQAGVRLSPIFHGFDVLGVCSPSASFVSLALWIEVGIATVW